MIRIGKLIASRAPYSRTVNWLQQGVAAPQEAEILVSGEHQCNDHCQVNDPRFGDDFLMSRRAIAGLTGTLAGQVNDPAALIDALLCEVGALMQQQQWNRGQVEASLEILLYSKQWPK